MKKQYISGTWKQQDNYKSFLPTYINQEFDWEDKKINTLLEKANLELGKLESFSNFIPDIDFFISMHIGKEAIQSSKIEGTKTELDDLFVEKNDKTFEEKNDIQEVKNYIQALKFGIQLLDELPLSFRLFSQIHKILLQSVRGEHKGPGEIRTSQNWIGGTNISNAFFIPPHKNDLSDCITDLEKFLHNNTLEIPELIKIALIHYQFETIHPYLDGNGRIGRLIIILYLIEKKILSRPVLYISDFFERNKGEYYNALTLVRNTNDIEYFIKFFLTGVIETCKSSLYTFEEILRIKEVFSEKILLFGHKAEKASKLLHFLFSKPIVNSKDVQNLLKVTPTTANTLLHEFVECEILIENTQLKRYKIYTFESYLRLFR
ncbi:cell filamentation protein Fic [Candidatus Gracilibacteria bacterium]|nr:MAG: cell filamentation protein Fic [Candidatus Gracilibacteria bacterium]